jgi:hypothetical protein
MNYVWNFKEEKADKLVFSDEVCFHLSGKVNRHNVHSWGMENPRATVQHIRDSPRVNVFCAISSRKVYRPFFFAGKSVNGFAYLDMLQLWLLPQLQEDSDNFILQQDGAPPHFHLEVCHHLNTTLPQRWIGHTSRRNEDSTFIPWPHSVAMLKIKFTCPSLPRDLPELQQRIMDIVDTIDVDMLQCVWQELDYRIDVCRVTRGRHMEHL